LHAKSSSLTTHQRRAAIVTNGQAEIYAGDAQGGVQQLVVGHFIEPVGRDWTKREKKRFAMRRTVNSRVQ
jgi:hypothetical protein